VGRADFIPWRLSADQRWLVGDFGQDLLLLLDLQHPSRATELPDSFSGAATFSPDGRWLAYSGRPPGYHITLWDLAGQKAHAILPGHRWYVRALRFAPNARQLASGSMDGEVRLWEIPGGRMAFPPLRGHQSRVSSACFSADGRTLLTAGEDRTLRWWNVATGRQMLCLAEAGFPATPLEVVGGMFSIEAEWNPGGNLLLWIEGPRRVRAVSLPTLPEIDARERQDAHESQAAEKP
jgi:WD40 repeat protein